MSDFVIRVKTDNTDEIMKIVGENINTALKQIGEAIEGYAKEDCPVDTGLLRNSITYAVSGQSVAQSTYHASRGSTGASAGDIGAGTVNIGRYGKSAVGSADEAAVYVGTNVEYGPAVEFRDATHNVGKAHFLRDAGQNHISEYQDIAKVFLSRI